MGKKRSWTIEQLKTAVKSSTSYRQVLSKLNLVEAGGDYEQVKKYIKEFILPIEHFTGKASNKGKIFGERPRIALSDILIKGSDFQSYKLKKRLFSAGLKKPKCEKCKKKKKANDGRIPLELDHVNGDRHDNRIENLRILCPNCHSLEPTHRGLNRKKRPGGGIGIHATLKML